MRNTTTFSSISCWHTFCELSLLYLLNDWSQWSRSRYTFCCSSQHLFNINWLVVSLQLMLLLLHCPRLFFAAARTRSTAHYKLHQCVLITLCWFIFDAENSNKKKRVESKIIVWSTEHWFMFYFMIVFFLEF